MLCLSFSYCSHIIVDPWSGRHVHTAIFGTQPHSLMHPPIPLILTQYMKSAHLLPVPASSLLLGQLVLVELNIYLPGQTGPSMESMLCIVVGGYSQFVVLTFASHAVVVRTILSKKLVWSIMLLSLENQQTCSIPNKHLECVLLHSRIKSCR